MNQKQKKELREHQSTRQLMGITQLTEHGVKTAKGELVFFMLRPDNLSVLSPEGVQGLVNALADLLRTTPKVNALVSTPDGKGVVIDTNLLTRKLTVRLDKDPDAAPKVFHADQVKVLRDGRVKVDKKEIEELKDLEN